MKTMTVMPSSPDNAIMNPSLVHERVSRDSSPTYIQRCSSSTASLHMLDEEEHHSSSSSSSACDCEAAPNSTVATSTYQESGKEAGDKGYQKPRPKIVRFQLQPHEPEQEGEDDHVVVLPGIGLVSIKQDEFSADAWFNVHEYRLMQRRQMRESQGLTEASVFQWDDVGLDVDSSEDIDEEGNDIVDALDLLKLSNVRWSPATPNKEGGMNLSNREETEEQYHLRSRFRTGSPYGEGRNQCHVSFLHPPKLPLRSSAASNISAELSFSNDGDDQKDISDE